MKLLPIAAVCAVTLLTISARAADKIPKGTEFRAKLMSPLSTQTAQKGDTVTAQVTAPAEYAGAILEGKVQQSKSGRKLKGTSVLNFSFDTLNQNSEVTKIQANITEILNSQGVSNVDEEGRVLKKKNRLGKVAGAAGVGALIGAIATGGQGAVIGAAIGAAAAVMVVEVGTKGANIDFAPGAEFVIAVRNRR